MIEVYEREWYGAEWLESPVFIDAEASYEQWIGLLYACAVFRGVLAHPPPWIASTPAIGYVHRVDA